MVKLQFNDHFNFLPEGEIWLPIARYFTPNGTDINLKGITPHIEVKNPPREVISLTSISEEEAQQALYTTTDKPILHIKDDIQLKTALDFIVSGGVNNCEFPWMDSGGFSDFFSLSLGLYLFYGRSEISYYAIKKPPALRVVNNKYDISYLNKQLYDIKKMYRSSQKYDRKYPFVGSIDLNLNENKMIVKPLSRSSYEELRNIIISTETRYKESKREYELYGLELPYYQFLTDNLYIELTPKIFVTDLNSLTEDVLTYIRSKYYVFTKDIYRAYSFNQTLLDSLDGYGGIILDAEILKKRCGSTYYRHFEQRRYRCG